MTIHVQSIRHEVSEITMFNTSVLYARCISLGAFNSRAWDTNARWLGMDDDKDNLTEWVWYGH